MKNLNDSKDSADANSATLDTSLIVDSLIEARRVGRPIDLGGDWRGVDLAAAYRMQAQVAERCGPVRGWKISAVTPAQQQGLGVAGPIAAPLLGPWFKDSGSTFARADFCQPPLLECEFAFRLGTDLPPRSTPYTRAEVEAAIAAVHVVIEVCDSRLQSKGSALQQLVDCFNNGGFVLGPATNDWKQIDYASAAMALRLAGTPTPLTSGDSRAVLDGDPVGAVVLMANLQPPPPGGLRAGQLVTTGSCTTPTAVTAAGEFTGDFGTLGSVKVRFD